VNMTAEKLLEAKRRAAMNIAYGPGKGLLTTGFMLWMSGSSIQIFSIMMTGMALFNPLKAIATVNELFRQFDKEEGVDTKIPKLIFLALQVLSLGVALYKCSTMGLLPVTSVDWVEYLPKVEYVEQGMRLVGRSGSGLY
jgi:ER membrane protein complex subunit 4